MSVPRRGGEKGDSKTTQYERRFGDDRRSSRSRLLCPRFDNWRDIGGVCDVHRSEISLSSFPLVMEGNGGETLSGQPNKRNRSRGNPGGGDD